MKKLLYILAGLFMTFSLHAQSPITITTADMPGSGDTLRYSGAGLDSLTLATYLQNGANVTWDFSHLVATTQGLYEYEPALQTPYAFFFFGFNKYGRLEQDSLNLGLIQLSDVYSFYENTASSFDAEGVGLRFQGLPLPAYYTDNDEIYTFPLDYNDWDSTTFAFNLTIPILGGYESSGYRINEVDGWGQVTTPFGTFDCIRVVSEVVASDSLEFNGIKFGFPNVTREYKWLANGEKIPVMEVTGNVALGNFIPTTVRYRDSFRVVPDNTINIDLPADFDADNLTPTTLDTVTFSTVGGILFTHTWAFSPNTVTYVNGTDATSAAPEVIFNAAGIYDVTHTQANFLGSGDTTKVGYITVSNPVNTVDLEEIAAAKIFPNPVTTQLNVTYQLDNQSEVALTVFDVQGRQLANLFNGTQNGGQHNHTFQMERLNLTTGVYLLQMRIDDKEQFFEFVITR